MSIQLAEVLAEADAPKPPARGRSAIAVVRRDSHWSGAELASNIAYAVRRHPAARKLPETEQDAVCQEVALKIFSRKGLERVAREYLARAVSTVLESRGWQDTAARYLSERDRQRDTGPMITPVGDAVDAAGNLAQSLDATEIEIAPSDVLDLARAVAGRLYPVGSVGARRMTARLVQSMAGEDVVAAMAALALENGQTLNMVRIDASRAEIPEDVEPADLLRLVRDVARAERLCRESNPERPDLDAPTIAAGEAVAQLARIGGSWDPASIGTGRSMPPWPDRYPKADAAPFPSCRKIAA